MDLLLILIIFPLKILLVTNGVLYQFLSIRCARISVYWANIGTKTTVEGIRGALCLFISSVTRSPWIVAKEIFSQTCTKSLSFRLLNCFLSSLQVLLYPLCKIASSHVQMLHNVHNFDVLMQKTHRLIFFYLEILFDIWFSYGWN